jgi:lactoylglutathione lyase
MKKRGAVKMNVGFVTVKVKDMEESIRFYTEFLGLSQMIRFSPQPGVDIVFLKDELGNKVELIHNTHEPEGSDVKSLVSIGFVVESVDNVLKTVNEKNIEIVRGPIKTPNGQKFVYVKDPNGVEIEFIQGFQL